MEAPEKIYVHVKKDRITNTWNNTWIGVHDVEYIRKNAFIDKVCEFIKERFSFKDSWHVEGETSILDKIIEDFKKYVEEQ